MRQVILLVIGLGIGIAGALLFLQSDPPEPDSLEERAVKAEMALQNAEKQIAAFEVVMGKKPSSLLTDTTLDRARRIAEDFKEGRPVPVDDVFNAIKPMMRTLAPIFEKMRLREQKELFDTMAGEFSRKYDLDPGQQEDLAEFLASKADDDAREYFDVMTNESTRFIDFVKAGEAFERDDEIDAFMEETLQGEKLEQYQSERLNERLSQVQNEADRNVQRLDSIVALDENQKDRLFVFMARSSEDFDPSMQIEGLAGDTGRLDPFQTRNSAILSVLRPDQRTQFEEHQQEQRRETETELQELGLTLPDDWDVFDEWD